MRRFVDANRHAAWKAAFDKLGQSATVRKVYDDVYLSKAADGTKMVNSFDVYSALKPLIGRNPTEIDYALFLDRATHGGSPNTSEQVQEMIEVLKAYIEHLGRNRRQRNCVGSLQRRCQLPTNLGIGSGATWSSSMTG